MIILILDAAEQDLVTGFKFYESQSQGLGHYFLDSVYADIESLHLYCGFTSLTEYPAANNIYRCLGAGH